MTWLLNNSFALALTALYIGQAAVSAWRHDMRTAVVALLGGALTVCYFLWRPQP